MNLATRTVVVAALLLHLEASGAAALPSPPTQPASGPGGAEYPHNAVTVTGPFAALKKLQRPALRYFLYEPADPTPVEAPVVLFLHGFGALDPNMYAGWIEHLVRKGYVVAWVQYQGLATVPSAYAGNALAAWLDAVGRLDTGLHVRPARDALGQPKTAFVGHSLGGYLSAILAARATNPLNGVPVPHAIVAIEPGGGDVLPSENLNVIPPDTKMVVVVGDADAVVCKATAVTIWDGTAQISGGDRAFLLVRSDSHGAPPQVADHLFPLSKGPGTKGVVDGRDFFVTFKLSVAALNCAFEGTDCAYALGNGAPEQLDMGEWSDGVAVLPMVWVPDPNQVATTCVDP